MESKEEKSKRYYDYLSYKRKKFVQQLTRVGAKLVCLNDGDYDIENFLGTFLPPSGFLKNKIMSEVATSQTELIQERSLKLNVGDNRCIDTQLIDALKTEFTKFQEDFQKLFSDTNPDDSCASSPITVKLPKRKEQPKSSEVKQDEVELNGDTYYINQVLNPGEMSKIFVQKSGADVVRSKMDKPSFEDENLESIYIYRSKNF